MGTLVRRAAATAPQEQPAAPGRKGTLVRSAGEKRKKSGWDEATGFAATLNRVLPGVDELADGAGAWLDTAGDLLSGRATLDVKPGQDVLKSEAFQRNWQKRRAASKAASDEFVADHPVYGNLTKGVGIAAQAVPAFFTGGASAAPSVVSTGKALLPAAQKSLGRVVLPAAQRALATAGRGAALGGAGGLVGGLADEGSAAERLEKGSDAVLPSAVIGAAAPFAMDAAGFAARKGAELVGRAGRTAVRGANRVAGRLGQEFLDPQIESMRRMSEALQKDGATPDKIIGALEDWRKTGASSPVLMDLAGENTRALLRAAASKEGPARNAAVRHAATVTADLQDNVLDRLDRLVPDNSTADQYAETLKKTQNDLATKQYRGPYQTPVALSDELIEELRDKPGQDALAAARADALERRDMERVAEIDRFLNMDPAAKPGVVRLPAVEAPAAPLPVEDPKGISLATFLRQQGGLRDDGGELAARDWARSRNGRFQDGHLVNPNGLSLDDAAHRAWEEGFFPDVPAPRGADFADNYSPVTGQMLLDRLEREARGEVPMSWLQEEDLAARDRWMDDSDVNIPDTDEGYWLSLDREAVTDRPMLSGATLDRTRIALGERGNKFSMRGNNARAGGSFERRNTIDRVLDQVPELAKARSQYRKLQAQRDAVPIGQKGFQWPMDRYKAELKAKTDIDPKARKAAAIGYRQALIDTVANPAQNSTGALNRLATSRNQRSNLAQTYGYDEADALQAAIQNEIDKLANARFISPNTGSQSTPRALDDALVELPPMSKAGFLKAIWDKVQRGATLTPAERKALIDLGTMPLERDRDLPVLPVAPGIPRAPLREREIGRQGAAMQAGVREREERKEPAVKAGVIRGDYIVYYDGTVEPL